MSNTLRINGTNIVAYLTVVDALGNGITAGQTVEFSIFDYLTARYWNNASSAFDSVGEVLNTAGHVAYGQYEYVMTGGWSGSASSFRVRRKLTGTIVRDPGFATVENLGNYSNIIGLAPTGGVVPANVVQVNGLTSIDGVTINNTLQHVNAMFNGRFKKDFPNPGDITFYKRDNVTIISTVHATETERTRVV